MTAPIIKDTQAAEREEPTINWVGLVILILFIIVLGFCVTEMPGFR